ncbi:MFS transporter [Oceanicella sp. SM1341]|uniref:MFS transporter n=1 Tax=Oceanicella sp. SM1341 TaxID=1548889 RepID=UPI000E4E715F|nr:MFS transporter [Oceanicella sp. SM1341]
MSDTPPSGPLAVITAATLLSLAAFSAPLTTLEAMTVSLGLGPGAQAWVMSAMPLGAAAGLLTAGALGDTRGRRSTFAGGLWLTLLASVLAALAPTGTVLIVARILQGLGTAGLMACGLGLLGQVYQGEARQRAAAVWAAGLGAGVASGPILSAALLPLGDWRAVHWVVALAAAGLALAARRVLPESRRLAGRVDWPGSVLLMAGLGCLLSALTEMRMGPGGMVAGLLCAAVVLLVLFLLVERRTHNPILQVGLFREAAFTSATVAAFASGAGVLALMSLVPTALERGVGIPPVPAAVILLAWSGVAVFSALGARRIPPAITSHTRIVAAILGCTLGQLLLLLLAVAPSWWAVLPGLFVAGIANGVLNASLGHAAVQSVPPERAAMGSAANNTARYLGSALGIALSSILIAGAGGERFFTGWREAVLATSVLGLLGLAAMVYSGARGRRG